MLRFIATYNQFLIMLLVWTLSSLYGGKNVAMGVVGISILLLKFNNRYMELLMGFFFILLLSDNLDERLYFAKTFKNIYMVFMGLVLFTDRKKLQPFSSLIRMFIPFLVIAVFALYFAGAFSVGVQKTLSYILLLIVVPSFFKYLFREHGPSFLKDLVLFFTLIVLVGYLSKYLSFEFAYIEGNRMRGLFGNPNGLGIFLFLFFAFYTVVTRFYPSLFSLSERRFIMGVMIMGLVFCGSRTAFISITILLFFSSIQNISPMLGFILLAGIILSYEAIMNNFVAIVQYMGLEKYFRLNTLEEGSGRFIAWGFAWTKIQDFFFFGGGLGNDEYIMRQHYSLLTRLGHQGGVHNSFLTLWFDVGIIGLLLYLRGLLLIFIKGAAKTPLAIPLMYAVLFSVTYESWLAGSLNPFTIVLLFSITLIFEDEFVPEGTVQEEIKPQPQLS